MKKYFRDRDVLSWNLLRKLFLIMKLVLLILTTTTLSLFAISTYSQSARVSVELKNVSVKEVLKAIESSSEFFFIYNNELIDVDRNVDINAKNQKISEILNTLFKADEVAVSVIDRKIVLSPTYMSSQQQKISGKVTDATNGEAIIGANVVIEGTTIGVVTDVNGKFSLDISKPDAIVVISFLGYNPSHITVGAQSVLDVKLVPDIKKLDEIVVVGYGTQKKINLTGAVTAVRGNDILQSSSTNVSNALAGRASGIIATSNSGDPGNDASTLLIRGINSFNGGTAPLIVVDGIADRDMNRLNPADIESVTILKDASAAIYGVRSANGVILVTTKRGSGKNKVDYDFNYGLQQYTRIRPVLNNSLDYMQYQNEAAVNEGNAATFTPELLTKYNTLNTNWFKETYRDFAPQMQHRLSMSGGTDRINYYVSGQYFEQQSNYKVSDKSYKQFNIVSNIDAKVSNNIKLSLDINARRQQNNNPITNPYVAMVNASVMAPWVPVRWDNGQYATFGLLTNPVAATSNAQGYNNVLTYLLNSKMGIDIQLPFIAKGLSFNSYYAYDVSQANKSTWTQPYGVYTYSNDIYNDMSGSTGIISYNKDNTLYIRKTLLAKIAYDRKFGNHTVNTFVAYEESNSQGDQINAYRQGFLSSNLQQLFAGGTTNMLGTGAGSQDGRKSYFGRLGYDYKSKYLAEFSVRYNGSFNFAPSKRWGTFPAASLGWRISEEGFFKNNIKIVDNLKLRASWAIMGSDAISPYQYYQRYIVTPTNWYGNFLYTGTGYNQNPQIYNGPTPNPNITWEKQDSKNIGVDISFLSNRLSATVDLFKYTRRDILTRPLASVPIYTGISLPDANIGESENKGLDFDINYSEKRTAVKYYVGINFTYTKNKIIFKDESPLIPSYQKATGYASDSYMIYETNGIYRNQTDIDNSPHLAGAAPGDMWIKDKSDDGKIDGTDMVRVPYSYTPKLVFGIPMGVEWKGVSIDLVWTGQTNAKILYQPMSGVSGAFPPQWLFDGRWTPDNSNAPYPRAFSGLSNRNQLPTDFFLIDGSFIRLKSAEIAYTLPKQLFGKIGVSNVRVHLSGFNLFSIDHFKKYGRDVENTSIPGSYGSENNSSFNYPQTRIYEMGLRVSF